MKKALNPAKIWQVLKKHNKKELLSCFLALIAGFSVASIGVLRLNDSLQTWMSSGTLWGAPFDAMMPVALGGIILILPCLIFFVFAYLLVESHSLGEKLTFLLSAGCLLYGIFYLNVAVTLAGVLCFWGAEIEFLTKRKSGQKHRDSPVVTENVAKLGLTIAGTIGVIILFGVIFYISVRGASFLSWNFITGAHWNLPDLKGLIDGTVQMGISEPIIGSFLVVGLCEVIALPLGLGAAIYLAEYAPKSRITEIIRFFIETLAGAPSIVIALFGFFIFVYGPFGWGVSWLASSVCLAFMTLPWNIRVAEEAMIAVPYSFREGSYALGATKWQTIRRIVLLSASPGVITGFVLGLGAALGETTVLILTSDLGSGSLPQGLALTHSGMVTLPVQIFRTFRWNIGGGGRSYLWEQTNVAFAEGFILLIIFLAISSIALVLRNYLAKKTLGH